MKPSIKVYREPVAHEKTEASFVPLYVVQYAGPLWEILPDSMPTIDGVPLVPGDAYALYWGHSPEEALGSLRADLKAQGIDPPEPEYA